MSYFLEKFCSSSVHKNVIEQKFKKLAWHQKREMQNGNEYFYLSIHLLKKSIKSLMYI